MDLRVTLICLLSVCVLLSESYRILCLLGYNGRSHFIVYAALCRELARRGHQVDMISHFPLKKPLPNYTDLVDLNGTLEQVTGRFTLKEVEELQSYTVMEALSNRHGSYICEVLATEKMQRFIKNAPNTSYDIVLTEYFGSRCFLAFGKLLNAPIVAMFTALEMPFLNEIIGNPQNSAFFPNYFMNTAKITTFYERLLNSMQNFLYTRMFFYYTSSVQTEMVRKYLNLDIEDIWDLEKNISLTFVNMHHSMFGVRPTLPGLVEVGGLHIEVDRTEMLPDLQKWLDESKDGVVYFSLGSLVRFECLPENTVRHLYASFRKISPVRVLLKVVDKEKLLAGLPKNILPSSWVPQIPVLRHPNVRLFVTHGGITGCHEALFHGIPIIGIPLFADQLHNVDVFVQKGMGLKLDYRELTEAEMDVALKALLNDPTYKKNALRESARYKDRPMSPMNTAIYWIEYVIRNGPDCLRSPAVDMPWWQTNLLDVYGFILAITLLVLYLLLLFVKKFLRILKNLLGSVVDRQKKLN